MDFTYAGRLNFLKWYFPYLAALFQPHHGKSIRTSYTSLPDPIQRRVFPNTSVPDHRQRCAVPTLFGQKRTT